MTQKNLTVGLCVGALLASSAVVQASVLHWARIHVYHAKPTQVFNRLGLTHNTRYGNTLGQRDIPDPSFPPGLTDVVPYNPSRSLLVHGTTTGIDAFKARVLAADTPTPSWPLTITLSQADPATGAAVTLSIDSATAIDDKPLAVTLADGPAKRKYQLLFHDNPNGTMQMTWRAALSLPPPVLPVPAGTFVPAQFWTKGATVPITVGSPLTFTDLAMNRSVARALIGQTSATLGGDYQITIQLTNPASAPNAVAAP